MFIEGMAYVKGILNDVCHLGFAWRRNYVCQIHGLSERNRGRLHSDIEIET